MKILLLSCILLTFYNSAVYSQNVRPFEIINQKLSDRPMSFSFSPLTSLLIIKDNQGNGNIYDVHVRRKINEIKFGSISTNYILHPVRREIIFSDRAGIHVQNVSNTQSKTLVKGFVSAFAVSPDGLFLAYSNIIDSLLRIINYYTGETSKSLKLPFKPGENISKIIFNKQNNGLLIEGQRLLIHNDELGKSVYTYSLYYFDKDFNLAQCVDTSFKSYHKIEFSPNGNQLACNNYGSYIKIFELGKQIRLINKIPDSTLLLALPSIAGRRLRNLPPAYGLTRDLFFINNTSLGVCTGEPEVLKYDIPTAQTTIFKIADQNISEIDYPSQGNEYFQLGRGIGMEMCVKGIDKPVLRINNRFLSPLMILPMTKNKFLCLSERDVRLIDLINMTVDSSWSVLTGASGLFEYHVDRKLFIYNSYDGAYPCIKSQHLFQGKDDAPAILEKLSSSGYFYSFAADPAHGIIATAAAGSQNKLGKGDHDIQLQITGSIPVISRYFPQAMFRKMLYDTIHQEVYLFFNSSTTIFENTIYKVSTNIGNSETTLRAKFTRFNEAVLDAKNEKIYLSYDNIGRPFLEVINSHTLATDTVLKLNATCSSIAIDYTSNHIFLGDENGDLTTYDLNTYDYKGKNHVHDGNVQSVVNAGNNKLVTIGSEGAINYWQLKDLSMIGTLYLVDSANFMFIDSQGYFMTTKEGINSIAFKLGESVFPVDQLDLYYNRPDLILKNLDSINNKERVEFYSRIINKRRHLSKGEELPTFNYSQLPYTKILDAELLPTVVNEANLHLKFEISDSSNFLKNLNVWINNVPLYGEKGLDISTNNIKRKKSYVLIHLSRGQNKIEVSGTNDQDQEGIRAVQWITYLPPEE